MASDVPDEGAYARWRSEKGINLTCAACGKTDFVLHHMLAIPLLNGPLAPGDGDRASFLPLTCDHCGYLVLFAALPGSAFAEPDSGE